MSVRCKKTGKVAYTTEIRALEALGRIRTSVNNGRQDNPDAKTEVRAYPCGKHWHLTSLGYDPTKPVPTIPPTPTDFLRIQAAKDRKREAS